MWCAMLIAALNGTEIFFILVYTNLFSLASSVQFSATLTQCSYKEQTLGQATYVFAMHL